MIVFLIIFFCRNKWDKLFIIFLLLIWYLIFLKENVLENYILNFKFNKLDGRLISIFWNLEEFLLNFNMI